MFRRNGVDVTDVISSQGGGTTLRNMLAGGIAFADAAAGATVAGIRAGLPVKVVGTAVNNAADNAWVVPANSPIRSCARGDRRHQKRVRFREHHRPAFPAEIEIARHMHSRWFRQLGILAACVAALEIVCRAGLVKPTDLVPPTVMVRSMAGALSQYATLKDFVLTLSSVVVSIIIAAVLGIAAGIVLHSLPRVRRACDPFIASYYALPLFALYPVLVIIFGIGPTPIIFTGVLYAAMSVLIGTLSGLDHIPRVLRKTAKVHRLGLLATIIRIYVPACSAEILGGITLSVSYAFVAVIASEFLLRRRESATPLRTPTRPFRSSACTA